MIAIAGKAEPERAGRARPSRARPTRTSTIAAIASSRDQQVEPVLRGDEADPAHTVNVLHSLPCRLLPESDSESSPGTRRNPACRRCRAPRRSVASVHRLDEERNRHGSHEKPEHSHGTHRRPRAHRRGDARPCVSAFRDGRRLGRGSDRRTCGSAEAPLLPLRDGGRQLLAPTAARWSCARTGTRRTRV